MSVRRSGADLGSPAEAALATLAAFPFPERDWEEDARAVEARLSNGLRGSTEAVLLAAPCPSEPGEPSTFSAATTPLANSSVRPQTLTEMARRSVERKQSAQRQLARESLALAARSAASSEQARLLPEAASTARDAAAPPVASARAANAGSARASVPAKAAVAADQQRSSFPMLAFALSSGGLALAAATLLWLRQPTRTPLTSAVDGPQLTQPKAESEPAGAPTPQGGADQAAALAAAAPAAIDPRTRSKQGAAPTSGPKHTKSASASGPAAAAPAANAASVAAPSPDKIVLGGDQTPAPAERPDMALPPDPALRPADSTGGAIPVKPSTGAVQAALGAVMSGARHCVAGDDAASSAIVVFGSDGHVTNVTVAGPAAGRPAGACIQGQLSRARVQPFASASFSISAKVRPD